MSMKLEWKKLSEESIPMHYRKLVRRFFELPDGEKYEFILKDDGHIVNVLALTPENQIVSVQQFRPGPEKLMYELPGGMVDEGEDPQVAAARELLEETGYAGELEPLGLSYPDGYSTLTQHLFIARNCVQVSEQRLDKTEFLKVHLFSFEEYMKICERGETTDMETFYRFLVREQQLHT